MPEHLERLPTKNPYSAVRFVDKSLLPLPYSSGTLTALVSIQVQDIAALQVLMRGTW